MTRPLKFLLVDFENVSKIGAHQAEGNCHIKVFLGEQSKLKADFLNKIVQAGNNVELIRISGNGPNALDFHIAYYLGLLATSHAGAEFLVLSKDTGFDPLLRHMAGLGFQCRRVETLGEEKPKLVPRKTVNIVSNLIQSPPKKPAVAATAAKTIVETKDPLGECEKTLLRTPADKRPKTVPRLRGFFSSRVKASATLEPGKILDHLEKRGIIKAESGKIRYLK